MKYLLFWLGASYDHDDAQYLIALKDTKEKDNKTDTQKNHDKELYDSLDNLVEEVIIMKEAKEDEDFLLQTPMFQDFRGFTDAATLGYGGEYFIRAVTMKTSKCDKCLQFYTTDDLKDDKVCNTLVRFKEFKKGSMVRLNQMGDWLIRVAEGMFKLYRYVHQLRIF